MLGRGVLEKDTLIHRLESMQSRRAKHGDAFEFEVYVGLTFATHSLVDDLAILVNNNDRVGFAERMDMFQDRFRRAPEEIRKSLVHYLGEQHSQLRSFDDVTRLLELLKK